MRISDWSSDVCSSDLFEIAGGKGRAITDLNRFEITIKKCAGVPIAPACCCGASLLPIASPRQAAMVCSPNKRAACDPERLKRLPCSPPQIGSASCRGRLCLYVSSPCADEHSKNKTTYTSTCS